jgi:hypothetical protein
MTNDKFRHSKVRCSTPSSQGRERRLLPPFFTPRRFSPPEGESLKSFRASCGVSACPRSNTDQRNRSIRTPAALSYSQLRRPESQRRPEAVARLVLLRKLLKFFANCRCWRWLPWVRWASAKTACARSRNAAQQLPLARPTPPRKKRAAARTAHLYSWNARRRAAVMAGEMLPLMLRRLCWVPRGYVHLRRRPY